MDDWNRAAPVALPRNQPVTQAKLHFGLCPTFVTSFGSNGFFRLFRGHAVEVPRMNQNPWLSPGLAIIQVLVSTWHLNHHPHGQLMAAGKKEIAFVVSRHTHYGAGAVVSEHVISNPDRKLLSVHWIGHFSANR